MWIVVYIMFIFFKGAKLYVPNLHSVQAKANKLRKENMNVPECYHIFRMLKTIKMRKQFVSHSDSI